MLIQHWLLLVAAWHFDDRSLTRASVAIRDYLPLLIEPLISGRLLRVTLQRLADVLTATARIRHRRDRPPSYALLRHPELVIAP